MTSRIILENITRNSKPVFLVGYMGSGKSTFGNLLAKKLKREFIDLDYYIGKKHNKTISEIFGDEGEKGFRLIEKEALREVIELNNIIVATGGGTPCFFDNMTLMNRNGITIYLKSSPEKLFERLTPSKNIRPLLADKNDDELFDYIRKELARRENYYNMAACSFCSETDDDLKVFLEML